MKLSKGSEWTEEDWIKTHDKIKFDKSNDRVTQEVIETKSQSGFQMFMQIRAQTMMFAVILV